MTDLKQTLREASAPASDWPASLRDFLIALLVFGTIFGAVAVDSGNAFPMPPPPELTAQALSAVPGQQVAAPIAFKVQAPSIVPGADDDRLTLMLTMAFALSALVAFNTTLWRHLRRALADTSR